MDKLPIGLRTALDRFVRVFFASFFVYVGVHLPEIKIGSKEELYHSLIVPAIIAGVSAVFKLWRELDPETTMGKML